MTTQDVEVLPVYSPESLPPLYSPRSNEPGPSKPTRPHYIYSSGKARLDLGEKLYDTPLQAYGKSDPVEGTVSFTGRLSKVTRVSVKVEATLLVLVTERGLPAGHEERILFTESRELYESAVGTELGPETSLPFSIELPETVEVDGGHFALPPASKWFHPSMVAEVYYRVTADIARRGLGRHERMETEILYLPKTRSVKVLPLSWGLTPNDAKREFIDLTNWATIPLKPVWPAKAPKALTDKLPAPVVAELRLPSCFFSGYPPLSFHIHLEFPAGSQALFDLHKLDISIHLVRQVSIQLHGRVSTTESIVGGVNVYTERSTATSRDIYGKIGGGADGQEVSWNLGKIVQIMHAAKVEIKAPKGSQDIFPAFSHRQRVWMNTDDWADNAPDREGPALGLYRGQR